MGRAVAHRQTATVEVDAVAAYRLVADASRRPEWLPEVDVTSAPERLLREGDRFDGQSSLLAHRFFGTSEVREAVEGVVLEERVVIGACFTSRWEFADVAEGRATITHVLGVEFPDGPLGRLERLVLRWRLGRLQRDGIRRLANTLSAGP